MNWVRRTQPSTPDAKLSDDYIVFVPTSTPEKIDMLQHAADTAGWPIHFRRMHDLVDAFHIMDEVESDYEGNAKDKLKEAWPTINYFKNGGEKALVDLCEKKWGIRFDAKHILFATDDSGIDAPPGVWEKMDLTGVPEATKEKVDHYIASPAHGGRPPKGGAGTEQAPVLSSMLGGTEYTDRLCRAIMGSPEFNPETTGRKLEIIDHSTLVPIILSEDTPREPLSDYTTLFFQPTPLPADDIRATWHYLQLKETAKDRPQDAGKTAMELGWDYIGHYSPRRKIVDRLATEVLGLDPAKDKHPRRNLVDTKQMMNVSFVDFDSKTAEDAAADMAPYLDYLNHHRDDNRISFDWKHFSKDQKLRSSVEAALGEVEEMMKRSDAFVLRPDHLVSSRKAENREEEADRFRKYYTLFSVIVAKMLIGRDMDKPVIIQNHDGCWDEAIAMHQYLFKRSFTKDFNFPTQRDGLPEDDKTTLKSNMYFDVISGHDLEDIDRRTLDLLDWHKERYEKRESKVKQAKTSEEGTKAPEDMFKVAVFLSAGNENEELNNGTRKFCHDLAVKGYGMITGGGDRYAMGAAYEGYHQGQEEVSAGRRNIPTWSGAYSTDILLKAESKSGRFGEHFDYKKCCADIYERMADMLKESDTVVVRAGGAGTMQEWMAFLILKEQFPDLMKDKNIIIYDPTPYSKTEKEPFYEPILRPVLGQYYDAIAGGKGPMAQKAASEEMGVYIAHDDAKVLELLDNFAAAKQHRLLSGGGRGVGGGAGNSAVSQ